jgi:hypothetical protein
MLAATSISLPKSGSIHQFTLKRASLKTQRPAAISPCAFVGQNQKNVSNATEAPKVLRQTENISAHATAANASEKKKHSAKDSEKNHVAPRAVEGTNLFSIDDDYSWITVEDLLTA